MILIAGGGLAGLSAAWHLEGKGIEYLLVEKEDDLGGLCRSIRENGYTFDCSGHLLHFQNEEMRRWVASLLDGALASFERRASIHVEGVSVPYPFQAHLGALPEGVMRECLAGFLVGAVREERSPDQGNWVQWVLETFGEGMARHFFFPYHEKLWGIPLGELSAEGLEWSVPRPTLVQVVDGALGGANPRMGYNPNFHYPSRGGIGDLPRAMARRLNGVRTGCGLVKVRWGERVAVLEGGERVGYDALIASVPLPLLVGMLEPFPSWMEEMRGFLRAISVWVLNVGVRRLDVSDQHWIYFPEADFPFFRVGCYTAFGPHLAPRNCSSLYVEIPGHAVSHEPQGGWIRAALDGMVRAGILRDLGEVDVVSPMRLPVAYVIHDHHRLRVLPRIRAFLEEHAVHPVGRYGTWGYGAMEQALLQGRDAAMAICA
jgi:protoporphyrinogen oxidase